MIEPRSDPRTESPLDVADFLESRLLSGEGWRVTEANAYSYLESIGLASTYGASVPGAVVAMNRRARRLGGRYPFAPAPGGLKRSSDAHDEPYRALLTLTQAPTDSSDEAVAVASRLFERLCEVALGEFGGPGTLVLHFGWPSRSGRPEAFAEAIRWLGAKLGIPLADGYRDPRRRDGGVDLVAWRRLTDGRTIDHRLIQCTIGHAVLAKAREVDVTQWREWLRFGEAPRVSLIVPYQLAPRSIDARQAERMGTLVIDRLALVENLPSGLSIELAGACNEIARALGSSLADSA